MCRFNALWVYVAKTDELKVCVRKVEYSYLSTYAVKCKCIRVSVYLLYTQHKSVCKENMVNPVVLFPPEGRKYVINAVCLLVCLLAV